MNHLNENSQLSPSIRSLLSGLRRRIRTYVWAEAICAIIVCTAIAFWISLAIDWTFEPSTGFRQLLLAFVAVALTVVVYRALLRKCFAQLSDASMALLVERRYDDLKDSLLTTVELAEDHTHSESFDSTMVQQVRQEAVESVRQVRLRQIFDFRPLLHITLAALLLAGSFAAFCVFAPSAFATWENRLLRLSGEPWPRATALEVEGFHAGIMKVARGDDVEIVVLSDITKVVPEVVTLFHSTEDSGRRRVNMNRHGNAQASAAALAHMHFQRFSYQFKNVQQETTLEIRGGDARLRDLRIVPVPPPTITQLTLHCEYPAYLVDESTGAFAAREIPVTGAVSLPRGTIVEIRAIANKPLTNIRWQDDHQTETWHSLDVSGDTFRLPLGAIETNQTLSLILTDTDTIENRRSVQLAIRIKEDEAPTIAVELVGIGSDITPNAQLPFQGEITDEYGITNVSFRYQIGDDTAVQDNILQPKSKPTSLPVDHVQDLASLKLEPGQEIQVSLTATDTLWSDRKHRLEKSTQGDATETILAAIDANLGRSQPYSLRVVTPERLRSILATREWTLTRRFKNMLRDFQQMRDSLQRLRFDNESADSDQQKTLARRLGVISAALRASRSARSGMRDLADDFERIVIELENNRIPTDDLRPRLHDRVAVPLRRLADKPTDTLIRTLDAAQATFNDPQQGAADRDRALVQADELLVEMNQVLKAMKASEEFNAMIERVRELMQQQAKLQAETDKARKAAERESLKLLDD
jgi:hypothetical protein